MTICAYYNGKKAVFNATKEWSSQLPRLLCEMVQTFSLCSVVRTKNETLLLFKENGMIDEST